MFSIGSLYAHSWNRSFCRREYRSSGNRAPLAKSLSTIPWKYEENYADWLWRSRYAGALRCEWNASDTCDFVARFLYTQIQQDLFLEIFCHFPLLILKLRILLGHDSTNLQKISYKNILCELDRAGYQAIQFSESCRPLPQNPKIFLNLIDWSHLRLREDAYLLALAAGAAAAKCANSKLLRGRHEQPKVTQNLTLIPILVLWPWLLLSLEDLSVDADNSDEGSIRRLWIDPE